MSGTGKETVLEVIQLQTGYAQRSQLKKVNLPLSFALQKGELVAIAGANGAGKSTLIKTLTGVIPKISGEIILRQKPIEQYTPLEMAQTLSLVLTEAPASRNLTTAEVLALGRHPYTNWLGSLEKSDIAKIREVIALMQLEDLENTSCAQMSDGQLQRVLIARALAQDTDLIILDEPTSHLDLHHKASILKLLRNIAHENGKTVLFSSHEIDLAIQLCDKMLLLTPDAAYFGDPCELIQKGYFDLIFPSELVVFNSQTGTYKINNPENRSR